MPYEVMAHYHKLVTFAKVLFNVDPGPPSRSSNGVRTIDRPVLLNRDPHAIWWELGAWDSERGVENPADVLGCSWCVFVQCPPVHHPLVTLHLTSLTSSAISESTSRKVILTVICQGMADFHWLNSASIRPGTYYQPHFSLPQIPGRCPPAQFLLFQVTSTISSSSLPSIMQANQHFEPYRMLHAQVDEVSLHASLWGPFDHIYTDLP